MQLPDNIFIVDDHERARELASLLEDLSWIGTVPDSAPTADAVVDSRDKLLREYRAMPTALLNQIRASPGLLRGRVKSFIVVDARAVSRAARALQAPGSAIAFIDFDYTALNDTLYSLVHRGATSDTNASVPKADRDFWKKLCRQPKDGGGCYFTAAYQPSQNSPYRVLCPATSSLPDYIRPELDRRYKNAVTTNVGLWGGVLAMKLAVLVALNQWIQCQVRSPLVSIWSATERWFGRQNDQGLNPSRIPHTLRNFDQDQAFEYREIISEVFGFDLPWKDPQALRWIHESLKGLCGVDYCGYGGVKRNLSVGSILVISMLAFKRIHGHKLAGFLCKPKGIADCRLLPLSVLNLQTETIARETAEQLFWLFVALFDREEKHAGKLKGVEILEDGRRLRYVLSGWKLDRLGVEVQSGAERLMVALSGEHSIPATGEVGSVVNAWLRLQVALAGSSSGPWHPGLIRFEKQGLHIEANSLK